MSKQSTRPIIATWYDAGTRWNMVCEPVQVVAFTDKTVTIARTDFRGNRIEERAALSSEYHHFYPTFEEAQAALIDGCESKIARAKDELTRWTAFLAQAQNMTAPKVKESA